MRPAWRILVFLIFFFALSAAGNFAVSALPRSPLQWGSLIVMSLAALVAGWIVLSRLDQRSPGALGFAWNRAALHESVIGTALGGVLLLTVVLLLLVSGSADFERDDGTAAVYLGFLGWTFVYFSIAAVFEELIFRGYPFQAMVEWIGVWPAIVIFSGIFAMLHSQNPNVTALGLVNIFLAGVMLSLAYLRTLSLWFVSGVHIGWNWTMASLLDLPVSGLEFDTPMYTGFASGPYLWTGGEFGPEAGIAGTLVLAASIVGLLKSGRLRPSADTLSRRPIAEPRARAAGLIATGQE